MGGGGSPQVLGSSCLGESAITKLGKKLLHGLTALEFTWKMTFGRICLSREGVGEEATRRTREKELCLPRTPYASPLISLGTVGVGVSNSYSLSQ